MKNVILEILKYTRNRALSLDDIFKRSGYQKEKREEFNEIFEELIEEKKVYCVNSSSNLYTLNPFLEGIYHSRKNKTGFVVSGDKEVDIKNFNGFMCMTGDKVLVRITDFNTMVGSIKSIIERASVVGEIKTIKKDRFVLINDQRYKIDIPVNIIDGTLVGVKLQNKKIGKYLCASLDKVLGHKNAPKIDEKIILYEAGFPCEFTNETLKEAEEVSFDLDSDEIKKRRDLREKQIFTIDGDDTKDIDDAISLERLDNGNYLLGVHIADVTYYVPEGSSTDNDARERGTSVYMPGVVSPMYPTSYSNGICSLNPDVDRFAISCEVEIDKEGNILMSKSNIFKSVIHSRMQMTYKNVNKILEEGIIPSGYEDFKDTILDMKELSDLLAKKRRKDGMLEFSSSEIKLDVDGDGHLKSISKRRQGAGEELIEEFMLVANEVVATYIYNMNLNFIYRVHEYPNVEKLTRVISIMKYYGEDLTDINANDEKVLPKLLEKIKGLENEQIYSNMLLRCMAKATYETVNKGHFGLGIDYRKRKAYTHFTSPIRRYPDTTVHRILNLVLNGDYERLESDKYLLNLQDIAKHSSEMEVLSDKCEREANKMKMAEYMQNYIGEEFDGKIVSFTVSGMYIELSNFIEGRVGYNTMDDFYNYDPDFEILIGKRKKKIYKLGDEVKIRVVKASKDSREIDFEIVNKAGKKEWKY